MQTAGFVLVGGRSARMGRDKALLMWDSRLLAEDIAAKVASVAGTVALVGPPHRYRSLRLDCIPDLRSGVGPLAGIETALASGRADLNLIVACDMPGIDAAWLRTLIEEASHTHALCVATRDQVGAVHPLCAVYNRAALPILRNALDARRLRLLDLLNELGATLLTAPLLVSNVNTPEEWNLVSAVNGN